MMKKLLLMAVMLIAGICTSFAQAKIEFDKLTYNFGTFSETTPVQKCTFTFTNKGDKPLVINQAVASCGCTVPTYTKTPRLCYLQWQRQIPRSLQEDHYHTHQWCTGNDATLC